MRQLLYIYFILFVIRSLQGPLGIPGAIVTIATLMVVFISIYFLFKSHSEFKYPPFLKALDFFIVLITIYGILSIIEGRNLMTNSGNFIVSHKYLLSHYLSILPIYSFYYFGRRNLLTQRFINFSFIILFISALLRYYYNTMVVVEASLSDEIVNNSAYSFLPLIPLLYIVNLKGRNKLLLQFVILLMIVSGMKRGAMLIGGILVMYYSIIYLKEANKRTRLGVLVILAILFIFSSKYLYNFYQDNLLFQMRIEQTLEGDSSGRDQIYSSYLTYYLNQYNFFEILFGKGSYATVEVFGQYAHNDWIEIAFNMGFLGVISYLLYWIALIKNWRYSQTKLTKHVLFGIITIYFLETLFSMSITKIEISAAICIGYCLSNNQYKYIRLQ